MRLTDPLIGVALGLATWELGVRLGGVPLYQLPSFSIAVTTAWNSADFLVPHALVTAKEALAGFGLSLAVGVTLALAIDSIDWLRKSLYPVLVISQVIPKIAIAPVFLVWFGYGVTSKILVAFLLSFFPIVVDTILGLRSTSTEVRYLLRAMGASRWRNFWSVSLPGALPSMFAGIKLGVTLAITGAIIGEIVGSDRGLGYVINSSGSGGNTPLLFAAVIYIAMMGLCAFFVVIILERLTIFWHVSQRSLRTENSVSLSGKKPTTVSIPGV